MRYTLTRQYARDYETPFAKFIDLENADAFIKARVDLDDSLRIGVFYRLFDGMNLLKDINPSNIRPSQPARYADGDGPIPRTLPTAHKVVGEPSATQVEVTVAEFSQLQDAELFIQYQFNYRAQSAAIRYRIFKDNVVVAEFYLNESAGGKTEVETSAGAGGGGASSGASFRPTPLATAPRPTGMPHQWVVNDKEDDKGKDK